MQEVLFNTFFTIYCIVIAGFTLFAIWQTIRDSAALTFDLLMIDVDSKHICYVKRRRRGVRCMMHVDGYYPASILSRQMYRVKKQWVLRKILFMNTDKVLPARVRFILGKYQPLGRKRNISASIFIRKKNKIWAVGGVYKTRDNKEWTGTLDIVTDIWCDGELDHVSFSFHDEKASYGGIQVPKQEPKQTWRVVSLNPFRSASPSS